MWMPLERNPPHDVVENDPGEEEMDVEPETEPDEASKADEVNPSQDEEIESDD